MSSRHNIKILVGALVCEESKLRGEITIGAGTIVHPSATIIAEAGPIVIGEKCLIEEQAKIIHRSTFDKQDSDSIPVLSIGANNVFEADCTVEACKIGDNNIFESKCYVGNKVTVTDGCIIGAGCRLTEEQILKKNVIVYGANCYMREGLEPPVPQTLQMDTLMKTLPNYHHIRRPNKKV